MKPHLPDSRSGSEPAGKSIQDLRAEFKADFDRAAAAGDDSGCLSPEEILALQAGGSLDPIALGHVSHCRFCLALQQAIGVDSDRLDEFKAAVRRAQPVEMGTKKYYRVSPFDWRLPAAGLIAATAVFMVLSMPTSQVPVDGNIGHGAVASQKTATQQVEVSLQRPSEAPLRVVMPATQLTVRDYAPQVAMAVVLSRTELTMPIDAPATLVVEANQRARELVHELLLSSEATPTKISSPDAAYIPSRRGFELSLPGRATAWVPDNALQAGLNTKREVLRASGPLNLQSTLKLDDGSILTVRRALPDRH